jgi:RNA polymerase sigma factor (sigma-70 family)
MASTVRHQLRSAALGPAASSPKPAPASEEQARWFAEEVQPHEKALRCWLRAKYPGLNDVDDLVQEAYLRLIRARAATPVRNPKSYVFSVARNAAIDQFRRPRTVVADPLASREMLSVAEDRPGALESMSRVQELEILREAIDALPRRCRQVVTLLKIHGLSHREVGEQLGISVNTVNAQLIIGLARCRKHLAACGVDLGSVR